MVKDIDKRLVTLYSYSIYSRISTEFLAAQKVAIQIMSQETEQQGAEEEATGAREFKR